MKTLIKHNLLYYYKNKTKLILSVLFIFSFFGMVFIYDNFELREIKNKATQLRLDSYQFRNLANQIHYDNNYFEKNFVFDFDALSDEEKADYELMEQLSKTYMLLDNLASQQNGGRLNVELTPFRLETTKSLLKLQKMMEAEEFDELLSQTSINPDTIAIENVRLEKLMATLTADDFNEYTITANNLVSNVFQGYFLLMVLTFILLLFYDLFSKDYDHRTYQILFSEPIERKTIFQSKVVFALIYSLALILIGCLMTFIYLLTVRRMGYNIIPDRIGYIFHPVLVNINPLTLFGMSPKLVILPMIINNLLALLTGSSIIVFWILLILTVSFKLRSSSNTLTASVFLIIATFFISLIPVSIIFEYVFPISNFRFYDSLRGLSNINFIYIWLLSALWSYLTYRFYIKDVETIDILGGDYND